MKNHWTSEEINKLRTDYAAGKRIKIIANELGRSMSAVNKTISRLAITRRNIRVLSTKRYIKLATYPKKENNPIRKKFPEKNNVSFITITKYLKSKGISISKFSNPIIEHCYKNEEEVFKVGNIPMSKMKILLLANRMRIEEKAPIFSSKDITWF